MDELLTFYPGAYNNEDKALLDKLYEQVSVFEKRGDVDVDAMVRGTLAENVPLFGEGGPKEIVEGGRSGRLVKKEDMLEIARKYNPDNPLYNDEEYAKRSEFNGLIAMPFFEVAGFQPKMPTGIGDNMVVSGLNHTLTFYKPIKAGDRLFRVSTMQKFEDITIPGSPYRTFAVSGTGKTYNQNGELVSEGASILKESYNRYTDPAEQKGQNCWESPDWWKQRPHHYYTDADWATIEKYWREEKMRGSDPLYWEDVKIGDEPTPTLDGPIITSGAASGLMSECSKITLALKKNFSDLEKRSNMIRDENGIYRPVGAEYEDAPMLPPPPMDEAGGGPRPPMPVEGKKSSAKLSDGRGVFENSLARRFAEKMIINWIGDEGWIQRLGWNIMPEAYGYESLIPHHKAKPELFEKFPYLDKVPYLKGKRATVHGLAGDVSINKAYVTDKYDANGEYFVDLIWWCETIAGEIFQEGFATVKLPSRKEN